MYIEIPGACFWDQQHSSLLPCRILEHERQELSAGRGKDLPEYSVLSPEYGALLSVISGLGGCVHIQQYLPAKGTTAGEQACSAGTTKYVLVLNPIINVHS